MYRPSSKTRGIRENVLLRTHVWGGAVAVGMCVCMCVVSVRVDKEATGLGREGERERPEERHKGEAGF